MRYLSWTPEEDNILKMYYNEKNINYCFELLNKKRTKDAIRTRAHRLGLNRQENWTREERNILKLYYKTCGIDYCDKLLGGKRSLSSIKGQAQYLGLTNDINSWSKEEDNILKTYYLLEGLDYCYKVLRGKYSKVAIEQRALEMGMKLLEKRLWTTKEDNILKFYYKDKGIDFCLNQLKGLRSKWAIKARAKVLGITSNNFWTEIEDNVLKNNYSLKGLDFCYNLLESKRTKSAIKGRARELGLHPPKVPLVFNNSWTEQEDNILKMYYPEEGIDYCYELLKDRRSKEAIFKRVSRLKIKTNEVKNRWRKEDDEIIKKNYSEMGPIYCCKELKGKKTAEDVEKRANTLGLRYPKFKSEWYWSEEEDNILRSFYFKCGLEYCYKQLKGKRTYVAIKARANKLGLTLSECSGSHTLWSKEEDKILRKYYSSKGLEFCYKKLKERRTKIAIKSRANSLGLKISVLKSKKIKKVKKHKSCYWTEKEDNILKIYYPNEGLDFCYEKLGGKRTKSAIQGCIYRLGQKN